MFQDQELDDLLKDHLKHPAELAGVMACKHQLQFDGKGNAEILVTITAVDPLQLMELSEEARVHSLTEIATCLQMLLNGEIPLPSLASDPVAAQAFRDHHAKKLAKLLEEAGFFEQPHLTFKVEVAQEIIQSSFEYVLGVFEKEEKKLARLRPEPEETMPD